MTGLALLIGYIVLGMATTLGIVFIVAVSWFFATRLRVSRLRVFRRRAEKHK